MANGTISKCRVIWKATTIKSDQDNATFNTNEDFRSQFNSDWAGKLLMLVDEVLLSRREDSERLKNLSTSRSYKSEAKGKDRIEVEFFGKFVLCSNNENCPVIIDPEEIRCWVRKIKPRSEVRRLLQNFWHLKPAYNTITYQQYSIGYANERYSMKTARHSLRPYFRIDDLTLSPKITFLRS